MGKDQVRTGILTLDCWVRISYIGLWLWEQIGMSQYDCFLSFDTEFAATSSSSPPSSPRTHSHEAFRKIEAVLKYLDSRHLIIYAKSEAKVNIKRRKQLYEKIDLCSCVVLLLTNSFLEDRDQLRSEFGYYFRSKGRFNVCVAVIDDELLECQWMGEVGEALKGQERMIPERGPQTGV